MCSNVLFHRPGVWIWLALAVLQVPALAQNHTLYLQFEELPAPGNNSVKLRLVGASPAPAELPNMSKCLSVAETDRSAYTVMLENIEHTGANQFLTYEFLVWRNTGTRDATQVLLNVTSSGSFADFFKDVPFNVIDGSLSTSGSIKLPVHSLDPVPVCKASATPSELPLRVFLGGDTDFTISVNCPEAASAPRLVDLHGPSSHAAYWKKITYESRYYGPDGPTTPVSAKSFELLKASVAPNALSALGARFRRLNVRDRPDDTIVFDVAYAVQPAGLEIPMKIEVPIVFYPFIGATAASLALGVALGWGGSWLLMLGASQRRPTGAVLRALALGMMLALIVFVVVLLAYSANCRLQLFGLDVNPFDVLVLFVLGIISGCVALVKGEELWKRLGAALEKILSLTAPASSIFLLLGLLCAPAWAGTPSTGAKDRPFALVALSACPDGDVVGLHEDGTVILFSSARIGAWRPAGRLTRGFTVSDLTCGNVGNRATAFVVAVAMRSVWIVSMDLATGEWRKASVMQGGSAGVAFDATKGRVFLSSLKDRAIYQISPALKGPLAWASIFGTAESIGPLAVDTLGQRLLVAESFSGVVYALTLDRPRQSVLVEHLGTINALGIDPQHNLLYIADSGRRTVWVTTLAGGVGQAPTFFCRSQELRGVSGVAVDGQSNVWVSARQPDRIVVYDPDGQQLAVLR